MWPLYRVSREGAKACSGAGRPQRPLDPPTLKQLEARPGEAPTPRGGPVAPPRAEARVCPRRQQAGGTEGGRVHPATCWLCHLGRPLAFLCLSFLLCIIQMTKMPSFKIAVRMKHTGRCGTQGSRNGHHYWSPEAYPVPHMLPPPSLPLLMRGLAAGDQGSWPGRWCCLLPAVHVPSPA